MPQLPSLKALRTFEAAARHLSFTRAAQELGVTQTAVSHQIKILEARLKTPLFQRVNNSLGLTGKGEVYFQSLNKAFDLIGEATERLLDDTSRRTITIGAMPSFAMRWLIPRLPHFRAQCPDTDIAIRLLPNAGTSDFGRDGLDAIIRAGSGWPEYNSMKLVPITIVPVCSPGLIPEGAAFRTPAELADQTLLRVSTAAVDEWRLWFQTLGLTAVAPAQGPVFDSYTFAWQAAIEGLGIAMGRLPLVSEDLESGRLVRAYDRVVSTGRAWYMVTPRDSGEDRKLAVFRQWIFAEAAAANEAKAA